MLTDEQSAVIAAEIRACVELNRTSMVSEVNRLLTLLADRIHPG
jgi:hypothetical protein